MWMLYRLLRRFRQLFIWRIAWILRHFPVINFMVFGVGIVYIKSARKISPLFVVEVRVGQALNDGKFSWHCGRQPKLCDCLWKGKKYLPSGRLRWRRFSLKSRRSIQMWWFSQTWEILRLILTFGIECVAKLSFMHFKLRIYISTTHQRLLFWAGKPAGT